MNHIQAVTSGLVTLSAPAKVLLECHSGEPASNVSEVKIIAISVGL